MNVNFPVKKEDVVSLGEVPLGTIIFLADTSKGAQTRAQVEVAPGENLFLVFADKKDTRAKSGYTDLVSLDGEHVCRRQNDRLVVVNEVKDCIYHDPDIAAVDTVPVGSVIVHGILDPNLIRNKKPKELFSLFYIRVKETPVVAGRIPFVSLKGKRIFIDDDRMVIFAKKFAINFK